LASDLLKLERYLELDDALIVDFINEELVRPTNFRLPWEALAGSEIRFTWRARYET
jgi:hypothetical protein